MTQRKHSSETVFTFDSLFDIDIGVVCAIREDFLPYSATPNEYINYDFLNKSKDLELLKRIRMRDIGVNIVQECFLGKARKEFMDIYKDYLTKNLDRIHTLSTVTDMVRLIKMYRSTGFISSTVVCRNQVEVNSVNEIFDGKSKVQLVKDFTEVNLSGKARLCVGNISDVLSFRGLKCLHIAVLNYACNFTLVEQNGKKVRMLLPHVAMPLWDINEFEIINPYRIDIKEANPYGSN